MNEIYVNNIAEIEGVKRAREKYPNREIPVYQQTVSSQNLCATLNTPTLVMNTDMRGTNTFENKNSLQKIQSANLQNINFSEWRSVCGNVNSQQSITQSGIDIDWEIGITSAAGIAWALLGISNPVGSAVAGVANVLLPILWPTATEDPDEVWKSMMANAEALVDKKIDEAMKNLALSKLNGLKNAMNEYCQAVARLKADPNNPLEKDAVRSAYQTMDMLFLYSMPQFAVPNFEVQLLPTYAEAANLHLLF
ncbi:MULTISPECIES: insecticidal delta-endotoxin Cry8Ea1 family protein, partial [Bacillus cereus group]